jgi:DNA/RNA-binding domain of Phe-tRNA-synthetase-like protein
MKLNIDNKIKIRFPEIIIPIVEIMDVKVEKFSKSIEILKKKVVEDIRNTYFINTLKDVPIIRAYRNFYWNIGIDPTKTRPAAEALIRRVLGGQPIPRINTIVDSYNIASIHTGVALAVFDKQRIQGDLFLRFSKKGERFKGIGMNDEIELKGDEIIISDDTRLVAIYPHRDSDYSKVYDKTKNILLIACGVPGIEEELLKKALKVASEYIMS